MCRNVEILIQRRTLSTANKSERAFTLVLKTAINTNANADTIPTAGLRHATQVIRQQDAVHRLRCQGVKGS